MSLDTRLLNGLNVLAAIVEAGNFVRAGEALGLTQSGVSRAMQRLEQCVLVNRSLQPCAMKADPGQLSEGWIDFEALLSGVRPKSRSS
jgi:Bacterial regulatory helix-turn-helix protein, lysR family